MGEGSMKFRAAGYVLKVGAILALLAGCAGPQLPTAAPGAMPQSQVIVMRGDHTGSWMLPEAKTDNLLYVTDITMMISNFGSVLVLKYPRGTVVGTLTGFDNPLGDCVDPAGDIWITSSGTGTVEEFAHGGTAPIATLRSKTNLQGCAVDPTTGNLAVATQNGGVAVWTGARGAPKFYGLQYVGLNYCGYDDKGNLFADGLKRYNQFVFAELPKGSTDLKVITLNHAMGNAIGEVQWDGKYITLDNARDRTHGAVSRAIYRVKVSGSGGTIVSASRFPDLQKVTFAQSWIQGARVVIPFSPQPDRPLKRVGFWEYPAGGQVTKILTPAKTSKHEFAAVTVSLAPSH